MLSGGILRLPLPQVAVAALPRHVKAGELEALVLELLHREADGGHNLRGCRSLGLQVVDDGRLARVVESNLPDGGGKASAQQLLAQRRQHPRGCQRTQRIRAFDDLLFDRPTDGTVQSRYSR